MYAGRQLLSWPPGTKRAWRVCCPPLPARQDVLHLDMVRPQNQDVDVTVLAQRPSGGQFGGVAARDSPPDPAAAEDLRDLGRGCRVPWARGRLGPHARDYARPHPAVTGEASIARAPGALVAYGGLARPVERSQLRDHEPRRMVVSQWQGEVRS